RGGAPLRSAGSGILRYGRLMARKTDEVRLAGNLGKASRPPGRFRLLDLLARAGDQVPPDVPRTVHRRAAQQEQARIAMRLDHDRLPGPENQELAGREGLAAEGDRAFHDEDCALLVIGGHLEPRAWLEDRI